ncbi:ribonuclease [Salipaludibacillus neizhouensis]|uniref:Ribonuclease n=1 Tax=Salipaludibacillus neizhouensis TaxID=885475 RepID=A0A3A9KHL7_9BACI|nr:YlzJ-like family protein [Salipaludibacillus neizhouensis]RKL69053.1 ribonuclease [Salipaludibacillus neizhouensis]
MILYTYENPHLMFPVDESEYGAQELVSIPGGQLVVEREKDLKSCRIVRLLATDPNMFLESKYAPGQMIQL